MHWCAGSHSLLTEFFSPLVHVLADRLVFFCRMDKQEGYTFIGPYCVSWRHIKGFASRYHLFGTVGVANMQRARENIPPVRTGAHVVRQPLEQWRYIPTSGRRH